LDVTRTYTLRPETTQSGWTFSAPQTVTSTSGADVAKDFTASPPAVAPTVQQPPSIDTTAGTFRAVRLNVLGGDDEGESNLTYTWEPVPTSASVTFSPNGTNSAKSTLATFTK